MVDQAVIEVPTASLRDDISVLEAAGFRLELIFPADAPRVAELSGFGLRLRLDLASCASAPTIRAEVTETVSLSSGATVRPPEGLPPAAELCDTFVHAVGGEWGTGRAGMLYRDLIPERHGGRVIASHIQIREAGPVPDYVHHHDVRFQMIYCRRGSVEVVYEDQGEPFWMHEGDCVLQPPNIRHRVLNSSDGLEVIEIASPAEHPTHIDHETTLPTGLVKPDRNFDGQLFSFDQAGTGQWVSAEPGWDQRLTNIAEATNGTASVRVIRPTGTGEPLTGSHDGDLCLFFILDGEATLSFRDDTFSLAPDDSVAVPRHEQWVINAQPDFTALHVIVSNEEETRHDT